MAKSSGDSPPRRCLVCMERENLKECSRCHAAYYCSIIHQKEHWKTHKITCIPKTIPVPRRIPEAPRAPLTNSRENPKAHTFLGRCDGSGCYVLWGFFHSGMGFTTFANLCIRLGDGDNGGLRDGMCQQGLPTQMVIGRVEQFAFINKLMEDISEDMFGYGDSRDVFGRFRRRKGIVPVSLHLAKTLAARARDDTPEPPEDTHTPLQLFSSLPGDEVEVSEEESQFRKFVERSSESENMSPGPLGGEGRFSEIVYVFQNIRGEYRWCFGLIDGLKKVLGPPPYHGMPPIPNARSDAAAHDAIFQWCMKKVSCNRSVYELQEKMCRHMALWHYLMKEPRCAALLWHCAEGMTSDCYMSPWLRAQLFRAPLDVGWHRYLFDGPLSQVAGAMERCQPEVERLFGYEEHTI